MSYFNDNEDFIYEREKRIERAEARIVAENRRKNSKPIFTRGYQESRERLANNSYYTRSCFNCAYYFQASGDKEEVCQNTEVLEYDMVVDRNNIYCLKWQPSSSNKTEQQTLFKKNGRAKLD